jgi:hypothetical protein
LTTSRFLALPAKTISRLAKARAASCVSGDEVTNCTTTSSTAIGRTASEVLLTRAAD